MFTFLRRPLLPTVVIGGLLVAVITTGSAVAATSTGLLGGKSNTEKASTTIKNTGSGPALKLTTSKSTTPPLGVSNSTVIPHLNASLLGGVTAGQLQRKVTGSCSTQSAITAIGPTGAVACAPKRNAIYDDATTSGTDTGTYVVAAGVTEVLVDLRGGGGGGGGSSTLTTGYGSGGGQGAYERGLIKVTPGETLTVTVGSAGAANGSGGTSEVSGNSTVYFEASGGLPGEDANSDDCLTRFGGSGGDGSQGFGADLAAVTVLDAVRGVAAFAADTGGTSCGSGSGSPGAENFTTGGGGDGEGSKKPQIGSLPQTAQPGIAGYVLIQPVA